MYKQGVKLNNEDGTFRCYITQGEAKRGVQGKQMKRVRLANSPAMVYQMIKYAQASSSAESMTTITVADMAAVAGLKRVNETWIERLIGHNLIPANTNLASQYL